MINKWATRLKISSLKLQTGGIQAELNDRFIIIKRCHVSYINFTYHYNNNNGNNSNRNNEMDPS